MITFLQTPQNRKGAEQWAPRLKVDRGTALPLGLRG